MRDLFVIVWVPMWPIFLSGWVGAGFLLPVVLTILPPNIPPP